MFQTVDKGNLNGYNRHIIGKGANRLNPVAFVFFRFFVEIHQGDRL